MESMQIYIIEWKTERFSRTESGKSWHRKPDSVNTSYVTQERFEKLTSDSEIRFWRNLGSCTVRRGYTRFGYVPLEMVRTRPDGEEKARETFMPHVLNLKQMGERERRIVLNLHEIELTESSGDHRVFELTDGAGYSCLYDETQSRFVG